jgi:lipid-binding SYLF domain-containing protein
MLEKAECVGVFPDVTKGAFIVGGAGGKGVFTCRDASGKMGAPAFYTIGGGSVGWQFGGEQTDLILLVMNKDGMKQPAGRQVHDRRGCVGDGGLGGSHG